VVALTKIDLVDDEEWLSLVEEDVRQILAGTVLESAPIVRVSARKRQGLDQLLLALTACLAERPPRPDLGRPRLSVDRVFTIAGFGTVVTGTLSDGTLQVGDEVEVLPYGLKGRVRGLQTHKRKTHLAVPGSRTAVNIAGVSVEQIQRGNVIAHPGDYRPTKRLDVRFRLLPDVSHPLRHNSQVKLFIGAAEVMGRARVLGVEELKPGEEGWLQLELEREVVAVRGDHYILRRPSPGETLGGGVIVDPYPTRRHKRFSEDTITRLNTLARGAPADLLLEALRMLGAAPLKEVIARSNLEAASAEAALHDLLQNQQLLLIEGSPDASAVHPESLVTTKEFWERLVARALEEVEQYHRAHPLRKGMPREELKSRLKTSPRLFTALIERMVTEGRLTESGPLVHLPEHEIYLNPQQKQAVESLLARFNAMAYTPPTVKECQSEIGDELFAALIELGYLVQVSPEVVFGREVYTHMVNEIKGLLVSQGTITAAQVRDHFNTSRRYALALLEHLDAIGVTIREGDVRKLRI
jgi:selenocysteine-specific elongation factor